MSFIYSGFRRLLGASDSASPQPIYIMSGRCNGENWVNERVVPCFCPKGQYQTLDPRPDLAKLECVCGHFFVDHDSSSDSITAKPTHSK